MTYFRNVGLTSHEEVLSTLVGVFGGRASAQQLADELAVSRATVRRYMTDMVRAKWAVLEMGNLRKRYIYVATKEGRRAYDEGDVFL